MCESVAEERAFALYSVMHPLEQAAVVCSPALLALVAASVPASRDTDVLGICVLDAFSAEAADVGCHWPPQGADGHGHSRAIGQIDVQRVAGTFKGGTISALGHAG